MTLPRRLAALGLGAAVESVQQNSGLNVAALPPACTLNCIAEHGMIQCTPNATRLANRSNAATVAP